MSNELAIPSIAHMPQPKGVSIKEGEWYKYLDGSAVRDIKIIKIRVHPEIPATFQVIFKVLLEKKLFGSKWRDIEMELSRFTRYIVDYNSVEKIIIQPTRIEQNA